MVRKIGSRILEYADGRFVPTIRPQGRILGDAVVIVQFRKVYYLSAFALSEKRDTLRDNSMVSVHFISSAWDNIRPKPPTSRTDFD